MSDDLSEIQFRQAEEAVKKMEPWRLAEIRQEFDITPPETYPGQGDGR